MRCAVVLGLALSACGTDPVAPPVPAKLEVLRGPTAISVPGQRYDTISVRLTGTGGESIVGWPVTWSGDGQVVPLDSVTDDVGIARAEWTLPRLESRWGIYFSGPPGTYALQVEAVGFENARLSTEARAFTADRIDASSDYGYGCGLRSDGLWCWGRHLDARWGEGEIVRVELPFASTPLDFRTGDNALCVLDGERRPWCRYRLGSGLWVRPAGAPPLHDLAVVEDGLGRGSVCGRAVSDLRIWCWSEEGTSTQGAAVISDRPFASISGGYRSGCAIDLEGSGWCWGNNDDGQLGTGDTQAHDSPVPVAGAHRFERISVGWRFACGSDHTHAVWCWGRTDRTTIAPSPVPINLPWVRGPEILVGDHQDLYVLRDGRVRALVRGTEAAFLSDGFANHEVTAFAGRGAWCLRTLTAEVYCGMSVLYSVTDIFYPIDLLPVPDPASQVRT